MQPLNDLPIWKTLPFLEPFKDKIPSWVPKNAQVDAGERFSKRIEESALSNNDDGHLKTTDKSDAE